MKKKLLLITLALLLASCNFKKATSIETVSNYDKGDVSKLETVWYDQHAKLMKVNTGVYYFLYVNGKVSADKIVIKHKDNGTLKIRYETSNKKTSDPSVLYKIDAQKDITGIQIYQNGEEVYRE